ncbi:hypothetical protein SRHO_G00024530 [Serrasalmus rhombeus]
MGRVKCELLSAVYAVKAAVQVLWAGRRKGRSCSSTLRKLGRTALEKVPLGKRKLPAYRGNTQHAAAGAVTSDMQCKKC